MATTGSGRRPSSGQGERARETAALDAARAGLALVTPEALTANVVEHAPDGILVVDGAGRIAFVNHQTEVMFGWVRDELLGQSVEVLIPGPKRTSHVGVRRAYHDDHPNVRPMGVGLDLAALRRDGTEFPVEISLSPVETPLGRLTIAQVRDISERKAAEFRMRSVEQNLTTVEERERIARDLHDTVIQRLFAVGLSLQAALPRIENEALASRVETAVIEIDETIRDIRTAIFGLSASSRRRTSLRAEILEIASDAARTLGFEPRVHFTGPVDSTIDAAVHDELLPTVREALSNVARHAHAHHVVVDLELSERHITLRVTDDGVGLGLSPDDGSAGAPVNPGGHGLRNMAERADRLGGTMAIDTQPAGGTVIVWTVPC